MTQKFVRVFQLRAQGKDSPKIGVPSAAQPGDLLTFFMDKGAAYTREVASVHPGYVMTCPLETVIGKTKWVLDGPNKVPWGDIYAVDRPVPPEGMPVPEVVPTPVKSARKPRVVVVPPEPEAPKPVPEAPKPAPREVLKAKPPSKDVALDLWSLLDDS